MMIHWTCDCGKHLSAPDSAAGRSGRCPHCGAATTVPEMALPAPSAEVVSSAKAFIPSRLPIGPPSKYEYVYVLLLAGLVPLFGALFSSDPKLCDQLRENPELTASLSTWQGGNAAAAAPAVGPADSSGSHWLLGIVCGGLCGWLILAIFPSAKTNRWTVLSIGVFTAICGVLLLMLMQWMAERSLTLPAWRAVGRRDIRGLIYLLLHWMGDSFSVPADPRAGFWLSWLAFAAGFGLWVDFYKAIPVLRRATLPAGADADNCWRSFCLWGLAAGAGFGIGEGILYSGDQYHIDGAVYAMRFISTVALHAIWTGSIAITEYNRQEALSDNDTMFETLFQLLFAMAIVLALHGLYDTLLKYNQPALALLVALASFGWLAFQIESMRRCDPEPEPIHAIPVRQS